MRLSYPKEHDKVFSVKTKEDKNFNSFTSAIANHLRKKSKEFVKVLLMTKGQNKAIQELLNSFKGEISVGTLLNINNIISFNGLPSCSVSAGENKSVEISDNLRRMSYYYFKNFADEYFREFSGKETFRGTFTGENGAVYKRIEIRHCESYI